MESMRGNGPTGLVLLVCLCVALAGVGSDAYAQDEPQFFRVYWYQDGLEHGNPKFNSRFRVNAPEVTLHERFGYREEVRGNGMMQIFIEEDLLSVEGAELYVEIWGGHPGTENKRVSLNGRSTYPLPQVGTAQGHCTHQYPTIQLKRTDLVDGYNAIQFACDTGSTFWGHFIVDNAALRIALPDNHADIESAGLNGFEGVVTARADPENERIDASLEVGERWSSAVEAVEFYGHYRGYDENGNEKEPDWHGYTKNKEPVAHLGTDETAPFAIEWDTHMLPSQDNVAVRAVVRFREHPDLIYETEPHGGMRISERPGRKVTLHAVEEIPIPYWSRAGERRTAVINLEIDPAQIEEAQLHVSVWDGGAGTVEDYFTLNGTPLDVAGDGSHDVIYSVVPISPDLLKKGENRIELVSDTEHHGIEVLLPGPVLAVRSRSSD